MKIVFSAGGEEKPIAGPVSFVRVISASAPVRLEAADGTITETVTLRQGQGYRFSRDYKGFNIRNTDAAAQTVEVERFLGELTDATVAGSVVVQRSSQVAGLADVSILATSSAQVAAAKTARRELHIRNLSAGVTLRWGGPGSVDAAQGIPIEPGTTAVIESSGAVAVYNPDVAAVSVALAEVLD